MKKRILLFPLVAVLVYVVLLGASSGPGTVYGVNATVAGCSCHNASATPSTSVTLQLLSSGTPVTTYTPGASYTIRLSGTNGSVSNLPRFGFQVSALNASSANAGTLTAPTGTHTVSISSVLLVEHNSPLTPFSGTGGTGTTYRIDIPWTAPSAGTGSVTLRGALNAVNFNTSADAGDLWNNTSLAVPEATQIINTIAGTGTAASTGDGTAATSAQVNNAYATATDAAGNIYIAEYAGNKVRKINTSGIISTFAGTGTGSSTGDGFAATSATLNHPIGLAVDASGNVYISEYSAGQIRKVNPAGIISTFATGMSSPTGLCVDGAGNLYVADQTHSQVKKVTPGGTVTVIAGIGVPGFSGDGGAATSAGLNAVTGVAVDASGNVYLSCWDDPRIRKINASTGIISTVAGVSTPGFGGDGGAATSANLNQPYSIAVDAAGNLYIGDLTNNRIRKVTVATGIITTVAGAGTATYNGTGLAALSTNINPNHVYVDASGNLLISDQSNYRIRKMAPLTPLSNNTGTMSMCAGATTTLSNSTSGGTWISGNTTVATVGSGSGVVSGIAAGTATITYATSTASTMSIVTVNPGPAAITGALSLSLAGSSSLSSTAGGTWTSNNTSVAAINTSTGVMTGVFYGTAIITYTMPSGCFTTVVASVNAAPAITSVSPMVGNPGSSVAITGTGFNTTAANNIVYFGGTKASVTAASTTTMTATVPTGATYAPVSIYNTAISLSGYSQYPFLPTYNSAGLNTSAISLEAAQYYTSATSIYGVAVGDLDGDGKSDIVAVNYGSNTVSVFRNTSTTGSLTSGSFAAKVDFATGALPYFVAIADIDGDNKLDLLVANSNAASISVLRNTTTSGSITTGSFATKVDFTTGSSPQAIAVADFDKDGKPDVAVGNYSSNTVSVLQNTTTPGSITTSSLAAKVDFATASFPYGVAAGDIDGDGKQEIIATCYGSNVVSVLRNQASAGGINTSSFAAKVDFATAANPNAVAVGDIDGDSKMDIVVSNGGASSVSVLRNTATSGVINSSSLATKVDFGTGGTCNAIAMGDITGDGKADICVAISGTNKVGVFRNTATSGSITTGSLATRTDFTVGTGPNAIAVADLDGDSKPDIVNSNYSSAAVSVLRNNPQTTPPTITSVSPNAGNPGSSVTITGTNFNSTAAYNIVYFGATKATVTASGTTTMTATVPAGATFMPVSVNNAATNLLAYSQYPFLPKYDNSAYAAGSINFNAKVDFTASGPLETVQFADIDGDGKPDMISTLYGSSAVTVFRNISSTGAITSGSFASPVNFTTGSVPFYVAVGDIDGDGKLDLAVTNQTSNTVSVFRNTSTSGSITTGSFAAKVDFATGTQPFVVAIRDFDGDGRADMAVTNNSSNNVSVFRNIGSVGSITTGSFLAKVDFTTGSQPWGLAADDVDGDGKADLVVTNNGATSMSVLMNTSTQGTISGGSFAAKVDFTTGSSPTSAAIADMDGDGKSDIVICNNGGSSLSVFRNIGSAGSITSGSLAAKVDFATASSPRMVAIGDIDGDGKPDMATANVSGDNASVFRNQSTSGSITSGSFAAKVDIASASQPQGIAIGDLDADGKPEIAICNYSGNNISVFKNNPLPPPPTVTSVSPNLGNPGSSVTITGTNFNTTTSNNVVYFGATKAAVTAASGTSLTTTVPVGATYMPISVLNTGSALAGFSKNQFIPTYNNSAYIASIVNFSGAFGFGGGSSPEGIAIGDLNGDGKPELVTASFGSAYISVYENGVAGGTIGSSSFLSRTDLVSGTNPTSVAIVDVDGDGKPDIVSANRNSFTVSVFRNINNSGTITSGSFGTKVDFTTGNFPYTVIAADIDRDGKPDLVTANVSANTISVLRNTSTPGSITSGSFAAKLDIGTGNHPYDVEAGDIDGDGKIDLVTANELGNNISVFRNNSTPGSIIAGSFDAKVDFTTATDPTRLAIGDIDGDGKPEIVTANATSYNISVLRNTGSSGSITSGSLATKVDFATGDANSVALADINGDGKADVITSNYSSNNVSVLRNTSSSGSITSGSLSSASSFAAASGPRFVAVGDLTGDGKPEIATTSLTGGTINIIQNSPLSPLAGPATVCVGATITLTDSVSGGTWTSNNTGVAAVGTSGVVTGVAGGTATISYTVAGGTTTTVVTVNPLPSVASITGPTSFCLGNTITLTDATPGGTWSSSTPSVAIVGTSGVVSGVTAGSATISYTVTNSCGSTSATSFIFVNPLPANIAGSSFVCQGSVTTLSDATTGGTWSSASPTTASVSSAGVVSGNTGGVTKITYTLSTGCFTTKDMTVSPLPTVAPISGPSSVCAGSTISLTDATSGGSWTSDMPSVATVNSSGVVAGVISGSATISYTVFNGCGGTSATQFIFVNAAPSVSSITGPTTVAVGSGITLSNATPGWASNTVMPGVRHSPEGVATLGNNIYFFGGADAAGPTSTTLIYNIVSNTWSTGTSMPGVRYAGDGAAVINNKIYVPGGWTTSPALPNNTLFIYNTTTNSWTTGPTMPSLSAQGITGVINNKLYVTTAANGFSGYAKNLYVYDTTAGWSTLASSPIAHESPGGGVINGKLYIVGGYNDAGTVITSQLDVYDPTTNLWTTKASAPAPIHGPASAVINGKLYLAGNYDGSATQNVVFVYDPVADAWATQASLPIPMQVPGGVAVNGKMYVMGGLNSAVLNTNYVFSPASWSSSTPSVASINQSGIVTGVSAGTSTVSYTVTSGTSGCSAAASVVITTSTVVPPISGSTVVCAGATTTLTDSLSGGTWVSSNTTVATIGLTSGIVTGLTPGTATISYTVSGSTVTTVVTVTPAPSVSSISGVATVCVGAAITLSDSTAGGSWTSSAPTIASVGATSGIVSGLAVGTVNISYTVSNSCGSAMATKIVTVNPLPNAGTITGASTVCAGSNITLSNTVSGGSWISGNTAVATVTSGGVVNGVAAGSVLISYGVSNSCGTAVATKSITVNPLPSASAITGATAVCVGSSITLSDSTSGGSWASSAPTIASVGATSGIVSGLAVGTVTISYTVSNSCGSAMATKIVTVNPLPNAGAITGASTVCAGSNITLSNTVSGGSWVSSNASVATVTSAGVVNGVAAGSVLISYGVSNSCGTAIATKAVTVNPLPNAGAITGSSTVCVGATISLSNTASGGSWVSSAPTIASVNTSGVVNGLAVGTVTISYTVSNSCGTASATKIITVNPLPNAGTITGASAVCVGTTITLSNTASGGSWTSSMPSVASVNSAGVVSGSIVGSVTISYTVVNSCGTATSTKNVTVNPAPAVTPISGASTVCVGSSITLTDSTSGGAWTSSAPTIASVNSSTGVVSGLAAGTVTISYTISGSCGTAVTTKVITVNPLPNAGTITGASTVCVGSTLTLSNAASGGSWISGNTSVATITSTGVITGLAAGTSNISYMVNNSCGTATATKMITVNPLPNAGTITGASSVCVSATTTLSNTVSGGAWTSSSTAIATVNTGGVVTGVAAGSVTISYTVTNSCGSAVTTKSVAVNPATTAGTLSGASTVCVGSAITLSSTVSGGSWSSSAPTIASVGATSGIVNGLATGTVTITYSVSGTCGTATATKVLTVNTTASAGTISGPTSVATGSTITLTSTVTGGTWTVSNANATITSTGVVSGVTVGSAVVTYSVTSACGTAFTTYVISISEGPCTSWMVAGTAAFSAGQASYNAITRNSSGVIYVAYSDAANANKTTVMKYSGTTWTVVGSVGISAGTSYYHSIALDATGTPYVAYMDGANSNKATVKKFNGSSWINVGTVGFSAGQASYTSLRISGSGTPYIAFSDAANSSKATVMKFNGTSWVLVGSAGFSAGTAATTSLALDGSGNPYVGYSDAGTSNKATVMKFDGTSWSNVGSAGLSAGVAYYPSLAIDGANVPYLGYRDEANGSKATVMTFNGTSWNAAGTAGFSAGQANYTSLAIDNSNIPYIVYRDEANGGKSTVMKYNGSAWSLAGNAAFSAGGASYTAITVDGSGTPYVTYQDAANGFKATTMKLSSSVAAITGPTSLCTGSTVTLSNITSGGVWTSGNTAVATIGSTGIVTGVSGGTATISYTVGSCTRTALITVIATPTTAGTITGSSFVTVGDAISLSNTVTGGVWTISNTNATISSVGVVTGVIAGTATVTYSVVNACGSVFTTKAVTVNGLISGTLVVCEASSTTLSNPTAGGSWSSSNAAVASVDVASGIVTGVSAGTATITYDFPSGGNTTAVVTVNPLPNAGSISGPSSVTIGTTITLTNAVTGGTWSISGSAASITSSGVVTGISAGSATVSYTVTNSCGTAVATKLIFVNSDITGTLTVCAGAVTTLGNPTPGGTWSSDDTSVATVGLTSGIVSGITVGTVNITYMFPAGGFTTSVMTVTTTPSPGTISGSSIVCVGSTSTLTPTVSGGTWSSSAPTVASVSTSGVVTGNAAGIVIISYSVTNSCGTSVTTKTVTVTTTPSAGTIAGASSLCEGTTITLVNGVSGGSWSSSNTSVATIISTTGAVTGISAGTTLISYTVTNTCGSATATKSITVNPLPTVAGISGSGVVCVGASTTLSDSTSGGTWSSSNNAIATVNTSGVVNGISAGTAVISYRITNTCGTVAATMIVSVNPLPSAGTITGPSTVTVGAAITLSSTVSGGSWSISNTNATITSGGLVTGVTNGTATVTYTVVDVCGTAIATKVVTVNAAISAITGTLSTCVGSTTTLSDSTSGGSWSSSDTSIAMVSAGGVVTGVATGTATITYSLSGSFVTATVTVNAAPPALTGAMVLCQGNTTTLFHSTSGGTWTSSNTIIAAVTSSGIVYGAGPGTANITYTLAGGCRAVATVTVNGLPSAIVFTDAAGSTTPKLCIGSTGTLTNATTGGTWSSSNATVGSVGSATGIITGTGTGTVTLSYTLSTGCRTTLVVTVNPLPAAIGGSPGTCVGSVTTLTNTTTGGTWSSSNTSAATIGASTGVMTGLTADTTTISYTIGTGCARTLIVTVNPVPAAISGSSTLCIGQAVSFSSATSGGTWSSSNPTVANVVSTGVVTGMAAGTANIIYTVSTGCKATMLVSVNSNPTAIGGTAKACVGSTTTLTDATSGGTWSSNDTSIATVGMTSGIVTGVSAGTTLVSYTTGTGCYATKVVTINAVPSAIAGTTTVCIGTTTTLSNTTTPAVSWTSGNIAVATVNTSSGVVTGVSAGTANITYTIGSGCFTSVIVTVNALPSVITGTASVCVGLTTTLADSVSGGSWSSTNTSIATIDAATGVVTGVATGTSTIVYTIASGCTRSKVVTVNPMPSAIVGSSTVCVGFITSLSDPTLGGTWSSANTTVATVSSAYGAVTGISAGTAVLSYVLPTGCYATTVMTVNDLTPITGIGPVCVGSTLSLSNATTGGTWSSSVPSIASVGTTTGILTAVNVGTATITYTAGCRATSVVTVNPPPASITGTQIACVASTTTLSSTTTGGTWTSANTAVATVDLTTGIVTGVSAGTAVISYIMGPACAKTAVVTINPLPSAIAGSLSICHGATSTLSSSPSSGTWSSSNTGVATVGSLSGVVYGVTPGAAIITYTIGTGCKMTDVVTVNPMPATITGSSAVCVASSVTLSSATTGGSWSSSNTAVATVDAPTGIVTGIATGTASIVYSFGTGCSVSRIMSVNTISAITGTPVVCEGSTTALANASSGGVWSSGNITIATVGTSGIVTGVSAGTVEITYTIGSGCASTVVVTVNPIPAVITGTTATCIGSVVTLSSATAGGTWKSGTVTTATIDLTSGVLTGVAAGTTIITYKLATGCSVTTVVTVSTLPATITGTLTACTGSSTILSDATAGGTWSSANTAVATVNSSGVVTGVSAGTAVISYALGTGCARSVVVTINAMPSAITGGPGVCVGLPTTLSNAVPGGTWSSSAPTIANVGATSGIVTGMGVGAATITYSIGTVCKAYLAVNVTSAPSGIVGTKKVCQLLTTTLSSSTSGGSWSSGNTSIATVDASTGVVTGVAGGTVAISYTISSGCYTTAIVTVNPAPAAITGNTTIWQGCTSSLSSATGTAVSWTTSDATVATVNTSSGVVTGVAPGTAVITYTIGSGCITTVVVTVTLPPSAIGGPANICAGVVQAYTNTVPGGTWSSSNPVIGTINSATGDFTGLTAGVTVISYTAGPGCYKLKAVTVNPVPAPISGYQIACVGLTTMLTNPATGSWSSSDVSVATTTVGGTNAIVTGVAAGTATITFTQPGGCFATAVVTVNPVPPAITGGGAVCIGSEITLSNTLAGGSWVTSNTAIATIGSSSGIITPGTVAGNVTMSYTFGTTCAVTTIVTVRPIPTPLTGTADVCVGLATTLSTVTSAGTWSSSNTAIATVGTVVTNVNGEVVGVAAGTATISYTLSTGCTRTAVVTVNACSRPGGPSTTVVNGVETLSQVGVYPNPNTGIFTVKGIWNSAIDQEVTLEVTDVLGKIIYKDKVMTQNGIINYQVHLSNTLANGMYILNLKSENANKVFHFVKEE